MRPDASAKMSAAMRLVFTATRMIVAIGVFAVALAITEPLGDLRIVCAVLAGAPIALLAMAAHKRDVVSILWTLMCSGVGALIAVLFCPAVHPPYVPGMEYVYAMVGVVIGFAASLVSAKELHRK